MDLRVVPENQNGAVGEFVLASAEQRVREEALGRLQLSVIRE